MKTAYAAAAALLLFSAGPALAQTEQPNGRAELTAYIDGLARDRLKAREATVAGLKSRADAEARKAANRATILKLIGGLPQRTPLAAKTWGVVQEDGFKVEKVTYDSLPGYHVTANLYVPAGKGPFPAIIVAPGHGLDGKIGNRGFAVNLARAGMMVLAYDIVSEGERLQHYDPELGASKVGRPTGEHSLAAWQTAPVGDHVSRYFIWDAIRGLDYLSARPDVDAQRLGALGCSGGGTLTAFLSALDDRVKATGTACFITDFDHLLSTVGPQDGEQSIPGFLASGLDLPDFVEMAAPRAYAVISTTEDMFPFEGAKKAVKEAQGVYALYGAEDRLSFIHGPGGHGALQPIASDIVAFFSRWLKDAPDTRPFTTPPRLAPEKLWVTPTGQLSTSIGGETIQSLNAKRLKTVIAARPAVASAVDVAALRQRLAADIRAVTFATAQPGGAPPEVAEGANGAIRLKVEDGQWADAILAKPEGEGRKPAVLLLTKDPQVVKARGRAPGQGRPCRPDPGRAGRGRDRGAEGQRPGRLEPAGHPHAAGRQDAAGRAPGRRRPRHGLAGGAAGRRPQGDQRLRPGRAGAGGPAPGRDRRSGRGDLCRQQPDRFPHGRGPADPARAARGAAARRAAALRAGRPDPGGVPAPGDLRQSDRRRRRAADARRLRQGAGLCPRGRPQVGTGRSCPLDLEGRPRAAGAAMNVSRRHLLVSGSGAAVLSRYEGEN
uniref:alpha/beta hydrolase family protein n=1 Tax=uncultured Caulobacter sp. TaxID=158749 RepID=UPI0025D7EDB2|nr:acetylxylan esterase [uncultured Caulobacter sp.]